MTTKGYGEIEGDTMHVWFDQEHGNDKTGDGTRKAPLKSFAEATRRLGSGFSPPFGVSLTIHTVSHHNGETLDSDKFPMPVQAIIGHGRVPDYQLSQHCRVYGDHRGCPGENTLGTAKCACYCHTLISQG